MKKNLKIYLISFFISASIAALPWLLELADLVSFSDVLEIYALTSGIIAVIVSFIYIVKVASSWKTRIILFLLNPVVYYLLIFVFIYISLTHAEWTGWNIG